MSATPPLRTTPQRVLITGATGYVGQRLVHRLCREGRDHVRILVRDPATARVFRALPIETCVGDIGNAAHVAAAMQGIDLVYHLAVTKSDIWEEQVRVTIQGTAHVVQAALQQPATRLVHVSSTAVYGIPHQRDSVREDAPYANDPLTPYARAKVEAERIVRQAIAEHRLAATILRPGLIYDPETSINIARIGYQIGTTFCIIGLRDIRLPLVTVADVVEALLATGRGACARGHIYHIVGRQQVTQTGYIRRLNARGPIRYRYLFVPRLIAATIGWLARRCGRWHHTLAGIGATLTPLHVRSCDTEVLFTTAKIQEELGWQPTVDDDHTP